MTSRPGSVAPKGRSRRSGTPWTRGGCITCKARRKGGCDRATPSCNNCLKVGRVCEGYGDLWVTPLDPSAPVFKADRSPKRRRLNTSSPVSLEPKSPSPSPSPSLTTSLNDQREEWRLDSPATPDQSSLFSPQCRIIDTEAENAAEEQCSEDQSILARIVTPQGILSHLSGNEAHYLQYHEAMGSQRLANLESEQNPLRSFLIPRAMFSPLLMKAVCAISAMHLFNRTESPDAKFASIDFYGRALRGLRGIIEESATKAIPDDALLAVGTAPTHFVSGGLGTMDPEAAQFLRGLYIYAYSMGQISNQKKVCGRLILPDTDTETPRLNIYLGFTEELLKLCASIAELPSLQDDGISLRLAVASINDSLLHWTSSSSRLNIPQDLTKSTLTRLKLVAECFRDAGFIYLHSILERIKTGTSTPCDDTSGSNDWSSLVTTPKDVAINRLLSRIQTFPLGDHCEYSALTFPLFIAGAESEVFEYRDLVLRSFGKLQENFGIGNTIRAKEVLCALWVRRDAAQQDRSVKVHWMDVLEELQWDLNLA
ncbi:hypothetical protein POX_c04297 [Penicillium oxalicum]|uniref:hypothetical protein n=1 Tax=Penicillium oxalicum TaxID=69781 RepID=UPI0020B8C9AF|nr:hypothetical protein POX_c04297 [Penicillium oxalicum]KAI2791436.1 hypothetical protein POX_c04297 [Penicillium oxalicum]